MIRGRTALALALTVAFIGASALAGMAVGTRYEFNRLCCDMPRGRNVVLSIREALGLAVFPSQVGQDKWVSERVFAGVTDGYFVDVGSADGIEGSNTFALERKGWRGICIDPFPTNMDGRTCQMFKDVVHSKSGERVAFRQAGALGGIDDHLGEWKDAAGKFPTVEFTTVTLGEVLARASAPPFIHFMSLDIEGAELEALRGFPFDHYKLGSIAIEHNDEEPKRTEIERLMRRNGYRRVYSWFQDDFYLPERAR